MILDDGKAEVTCNFCRARYEFDEAELETIRRENSKRPARPADRRSRGSGRDRDIRVLIARARRPPIPHASWGFTRRHICCAASEGRMTTEDSRPLRGRLPGRQSLGCGIDSTGLQGRGRLEVRRPRTRSIVAGAIGLGGAVFLAGWLHQSRAEAFGSRACWRRSGSGSWCSAPPASPPGTGPSHAGSRPARAAASTRWRSRFPSVSPSSSWECTWAGSCICSGRCSRSPGQLSS